MIKIDEKLYEKIEGITLTNYELNNGEASEEIAYDMLDDLVIAYESLQKKFKEYKEMVHDNYEEISPYKKYAVSESEI